MVDCAAIFSGCTVQQKIYILGICGTFMGGLALLARERGYAVAGCDANVYPPMSTQLEEAGIALDAGFDPARLPEDATIVVGNALSRGNPCVEAMLDRGLRFRSGPQWLAEELLADRWVLAASGTHGKTTVSSMLAWILECAGLEPGFLIGGVPANFGVSARAGGGRFFVVEADEYDTAFFDKRAKFVHYGPRTLVINNLEFDHADIYPDLAAIQRQFHHLLRCVPGNGRVLTPAGAASIEETLAMGCWTPRQTLALDGPGDWQATVLDPSGMHWSLRTPAEEEHELRWSLRGRHNIANGLAAVAAAEHVGVEVATAVAALADFRGVRRRLELLGEPRGVRVYDDFAHHPTAISTTLEGLAADLDGSGRLLALIEPRSNTMRMGEHRGALAQSVAAADRVYWYQPEGLDWSLDEVVAAGVTAASVHGAIDELVATVAAEALPGDVVVIMSNGSFGGIHRRLLAALEEPAA
jgi:UDP-N-acetylmuramate: L-alanyl-gamma-D-glutamyl-meso-diaminopimelate ligase